MRLPLYTQVIRGKPLRVGGTYGSRTPAGYGGEGREEEQQEDENESERESEGKGDEGGDGDETEDLEVLLRTVKVSLYIRAFLLVSEVKTKSALMVIVEIADSPAAFPVSISSTCIWLNLA